MKKWLRSSAWLEHRPFKPGVGGSNPLGAMFLNTFNQKIDF